LPAHLVREQLEQLESRGSVERLQVEVHHLEHRGGLKAEALGDSLCEQRHTFRGTAPSTGDSQEVDMARE
jgi:hypothetical protein